MSAGVNVLPIRLAQNQPRPIPRGQKLSGQADCDIPESFKHHTTVNVKGSYKDDVALLPEALPAPKTPASFAYRLDSKELGKYEWMMITFVPDDAGVSELPACREMRGCESGICSLLLCY